MWRCKFGLHPWPKWGEPKEGVMTRGLIWSDKESNEPVFTQNRTCPSCNKYARRMLNVFGAVINY